MKSILLETADVLDKLAAYVDSVEIQRDEVSTASARSLAEKVADSLGQPVTDDLVAKIAQADPNMVSLLAQLAQSGDSIDSMGGPAPTHTTKTAGNGQMGTAEASLMNWLSE